MMMINEQAKIGLTRDESWVRFNERVLQEAKNPNVPLLERIRFLAIYSSNFDEFFRVRISRLRKYKILSKQDRREFIKKPGLQLKQIMEEVIQLQDESESTFFDEILPDLRNHNIDLLFTDTVTQQQTEFILEYYHSTVRNLLKFIDIDKNEPFPFLENHQLYFAMDFENGELTLVNLPTDELDRFVEIPTTNSSKALIFLDDIIRIGLKHQFKQLIGCYVVKISRDADLEIEDEFEGDLIQKLKDELIKRDLGSPTRLVYDKTIPKNIRSYIRKSLGLKKYDLVPGGRYHNFTDLFSFPNLTNNPALEYEEMPPIPHPFLEFEQSLIQVINDKNILLSYPYQKFDYIPKLLSECAVNPDVEHIKITLYRVSRQSTVANSLLNALKNGKKVTVFIEAKARFDENNNLYWGQVLKDAGANVLYSFPAIKVHTKIFLVKMKPDSELQSIVYIGTGNFNEKTAKIYADHAFITSDKKKVSDIEKVFQLLEGKIILPQPKELLVSPFNTRSTFNQLIDQEIKNKLSGKSAYMVLKMNSLEDPELIEKLYEASQAGVEIQLIVRGLCCLTPGVPGLSENIQIISIIDRFLEHARIYIFGNNNDERYYIGSADWMTRNLDKRVEVLTPIIDTDILKVLESVINIQLADNVKARIIDEEQNNFFIERAEGEPKIRSQYELYAFFKRFYEKHKID